MVDPSIDVCLSMLEVGAFGIGDVGESEDGSFEA